MTLTPVSVLPGKLHSRCGQTSYFIMVLWCFQLGQALCQTRLAVFVVGSHHVGGGVGLWVIVWTSATVYHYHSVLHYSSGKLNRSNSFLQTLILILFSSQPLSSSWPHWWSRRWARCHGGYISLPWGGATCVQTRVKRWQEFHHSCWKPTRKTSSLGWSLD